MRSAIGNSLLMSLVVIVVSAILILFVSILSYSKAYRVKNKLIEIIEKNDGYDNDDLELKEEINEYLHQSGYKVGGSAKCQNSFESKGIEVEKIYSSSDYNYCIGEKSAEDGSKYYVVLTYVEFNFPIVGSINPISVSGETRILGKKYDN